MVSNKATLLAWIDIASKDLVSAQKLATPPNPQWETALYHCQQAAEKATKALLILHGESPPKLHDIGLLIDKFGKFGNDLNDLEVIAERLTDYATKYRYPSFQDDDDPLSQEIVDRAIADASTFLARAETLIEAHFNKEASAVTSENAEGNTEVCERCNEVPCRCRSGAAVQRG
jgi:HEPN domain-containing protein